MALTVAGIKSRELMNPICWDDSVGMDVDQNGKDNAL